MPQRAQMELSIMSSCFRVLSISLRCIRVDETLQLMTSFTASRFRDEKVQEFHRGDKFFTKKQVGNTLRYME